MTWERQQSELRDRGFTVTGESDMDLEGFSAAVIEAFFNEEALPPVPDAYGPVATRYRNKAIVHYRWTDAGELELKEISDARYAVIGTGEATRTVPWFRWLALEGAEHFTRSLLSMVPQEQRHPEGTFGLHCFRSFSQVVGGPHTDGFEFGGTYVAERTAGGGVSYLYNAAGHKVLEHQLQPGEILLFHEHFPNEGAMFLHGATGLEGEGRRDAMVIQFDAPEDLQAAATEKHERGEHLVTTTYDVFLFGDELDMLECRLTEAEDKGRVRHVLIEAEYDHRGSPKPLYYAENKGRFAQWADRITHVIADIPGPGNIDPWLREHAQREHVWAGLDDAEPDDIVLLCDVDEIPSPNAYRLQGIRYMHALNMKQSMFAVDWVIPRESRIAIAGPRSALHVPAWQVRDNGMRSILPELGGMGWHFTWLGGPDAIRRKAEQFCHLELRDMILKANEDGLLYEGGMTWHSADPAVNDPYPPPAPRHSMIPAAVDQAWPRYIRERKCPDNWFRPVEEAS